ncbi:MAG: hypothetical protein MI867_30215, partial [Pseudomonadales bacterium]|nr:hypothetical protein [Pseudomonadales bacterium]
MNKTVGRSKYAGYQVSRSALTKSVLALAIGATLAGCGGDDNDYKEVQTGVFLDSPVAGVSYQTGSQSGVTNANGEFDYVEGESVTFSIGGITFPAASAEGVVTPLDLAGSNNPYDPAANNIARLLQSLDSDNNPDNGITIDEAARSAAASVTISDWSDTTAFASTFASAFPAETLVSATDAAEHLEESLAEENGFASLTLIGRFNE